MGGLDHHAGQGKQGDGVGDDHQVVEHIGQLPHQIVGHQSAQEDEHQGDDGVDHHGLLAEQVDGVDLAEQVPAQYGGEGEEEQADGHEHGAQALAKDGAECGLSQVGLSDALGNGAGGQNAVGGVQGGDDDQSVQSQHHESVHEHADHGYHALVVGISDVGLGVGVGSGAHAGLVGEQAPLGALADGGLDGVAEAAADDCLGLEGVLKDHSKGGRQVLDTGDQHHQAAQQEDGRHDGDHLLGDGGQTLDAAQEDKAADDYQDHTHDPGGDAEGGLEGGADGVGLDHAAHEAQGQDDGHGEEAGQELAEGALEGGGDVVDGTAVDGAVLVDDPGLQSQGGLGVDGGHAVEGNDPHPEDSAGTAGEDGAGSADDVAGTYLGGNGGGQSLEGAHAPLLLTAPQGQVAKNLLHALAEAANLDEPGLNGIPHAHGNEQEHQNVAGQIVVDIGYDREKCVFQGC